MQKPSSVFIVWGKKSKPRNGLKERRKMEKFQPDFGKAHKIYQYSKRNVPKDFKESYQLEKISILRIVKHQQCAFSDGYTVALCILRLLYYSSMHSQIVTLQHCTFLDCYTVAVYIIRIVTLQNCAFSDCYTVALCILILPNQDLPHQRDPKKLVTIINHKEQIQMVLSSMLVTETTHSSKSARTKVLFL